MRRVIIQIFSLYMGIFFAGGAVLLHERPLARFLLISGAMYLIVVWKLFKFRERTNMLYISMFLFLSFLINFFMIHNFLTITVDKLGEYIFRTMPEPLKGGFLILSLGIVLLALVEFANSKVMD